jgi:hypothetical protein
VSLVKERMQAIGLVPEGFQHVFQFGVQILNVLRDDVGQGAAFGLIPNILHRIEFRRVGWEPFDLKPRCAILEESSGGGAVSRQAIPHQNDWTAQIPMNMADKSNEIRSPRIVIQEFVVQSQSQCPGRACNGCDCRNCQSAGCLPTDTSRRSASPRQK